jgi:hypothetical protein
LGWDHNELFKVEFIHISDAQPRKKRQLMHFEPKLCTNGSVQWTHKTHHDSNLGGISIFLLVLKYITPHDPNLGGIPIFLLVLKYIVP